MAHGSGIQLRRRHFIAVSGPLAGYFAHFIYPFLGIRSSISMSVSKNSRLQDMGDGFCPSPHCHGKWQAATTGTRRRLGVALSSKELALFFSSSLGFRVFHPVLPSATAPLRCQPRRRARSGCGAPSASLYPAGRGEGGKALPFREIDKFGDPLESILSSPDALSLGPSGQVD